MRRELVLPNFSLGWELEATEAARRPLKNIQVDHDGSVGGESLEYRTSRSIVYDTQKSLAALRHLATDPFLRTNESCGFHVHIGLGRRSKMIHRWAAAFVALARHIEPEAMVAVPASRRGNNYCRSWNDSRDSVIHKSYSGSKHGNHDRYNWVNPVEVFRPHGIRTIEIRLMGEVHNYPYLLSWISFCRLMAFSAWALATGEDLSREQQEIDTLKGVLRIIRETFQQPNTSRAVAKNTVYLAHKARLIHPYGDVLSRLKEKERLIVYESFRDAQEREQFQDLIREMKRYARRTQEVTTDSNFAHGIELGDTVECIQRPPDGNLTVGRNYRVVDVTPLQILVTGDNTMRWHVNPACVRFVARLELEPCAA